MPIDRVDVGFGLLYSFSPIEVTEGVYAPSVTAIISKGVLGANKHFSFPRKFEINPLLSLPNTPNPTQHSQHKVGDGMEEAKIEHNNAFCPSVEIG